MSQFTVQLLDNQNGRIVLDEVEAANSGAAATAALAAPPVTGAGAAAFNAAGNNVDQAQELKGTGLDTNGNALIFPVRLPVFPLTQPSRSL